MRELLEQISVALGYDGEINEQVSQWVDRVADRYGYEGDELTKYAVFAIRYWENTGWLPCTPR
jgi:hypothetical protein